MDDQQTTNVILGITLALLVVIAIVWLTGSAVSKRSNPGPSPTSTAGTTSR